MVKIWYKSTHSTVSLWKGGVVGSAFHLNQSHIVCVADTLHTHAGPVRCMHWWT